MYSLTNLCFLCLARSETIKSVHSTDDDDIIIEIKLGCILSELISFKPEIPKNICVDCLKGLNYVYKFKQKCLQNLKSLSAYLEKISSEPNHFLTNFPATKCKPDLENASEDAIEVVVKIEPQDIHNNEANYEPSDQETETNDSNSNSGVTQEINNPRQYKCPECHKAFLTASHLKTHFRSHTGSRPFKCQTCQKSFILLQHLKTHEKIHTGIKPFACDICGKHFAEKATLTVHKRIHGNVRPYQCPQCNKKFTVASNLSRHMRIHNGDRPYQCEVCLRKFTQIDVLKNHIRTHTGQRPYVCNYCPRTYTTQGELAKHRKKQHLSEVNRENQTKDDSFQHFLVKLTDENAKESTSEDVESKTDKLTETVTADDLDFEHDISEDPLPISPECPNSRFKCQECNKTFSASRALRTHIRIHTGERPYICGVCQKTFIQLQHLKTHERIHTGTKPYSCDVCNKRFYTMGHVTTHKRIHSNVKPYQCTLCEKTFSEAGNLGRHMRVHNG